jgi:hypothetical protein
MAKLPPKPTRGDVVRTRRTAKAIPAARTQPGAVAVRFSDAHEDGTPTEHDAREATERTTDAAITKRRLFMETALRRFRMSNDAESELRNDMLSDMEFYNSDQWPDHIKAARILDNRVSLTINRLPQFVRQVVNQGRQSKPAIQVNPVDNGADPDTAEVYQGICRNIERTSKAHIAYGTASEHQAIIGRGWWRLLAEYAHDDSLEQEIRIKRVADPFTVYPDPACSEPDNSDASFCFVIERLNRDVYNAKYRTTEDEPPLSAAEFQGFGAGDPLWLSTDGVQVAEYFYIEYTKAQIAEVITGADTEAPVRVTLRRSAIKPEDLIPVAGSLTGKVVILKERETVHRQVKWALINGSEIIRGNKDKTAGRDLPGTFIPVIPVIGEELVVNGRRNLRGMVRDAKEPQRAYNYWISNMTERLALASKAPIIVAEGQLEGHTAKWNQSNNRNYPYLEYRPIDLNGSLVPPPQRASYDPDLSAALQLTMQADRDLKSVIGMFDASQEQSREQSGKAILARQRQGEEGTSHFLDNLSRAIEHTGRILIEWIPIYYSVPKMLRINGIDEQPHDVLVHANNGQAAQQMAEQHPLGKNIKSGRPFDLGIGRYDVTISVGPSYQSRRQETVEAILDLLKAFPDLTPVVADVLMENMDWPGARQLVPRLRRMVPANVKDPEDGEPEIPPEVQQQLAQLQQQLEAAMAALAEKDDIIRTKAQELAARGDIARLEIQSKTRLAELKAQGDTILAIAELKAKDGLALLNAQLQEIQQRLDHAHDEKMQILAADLMPPPKPGGAGASASA